MNTKFGWIIVVILGAIVVVVAVFVFRTPMANDVWESGAQDELGTSASRASHRIMMKDNQFVPGELTINAGDEVVFVNEDVDPHWPASGVHPTHLLCPGFDSRRGIAKGEMYTYVFEAPATCPMHDHSLPGMKGKIIIN
ncbi:MAG: hypothetical protein HYW90_03360 [Candidatus Sungbacteria bacterium]|nr:hypothetical protein [Candidatus Sungbacteria bacterium]